MGGLSIKEAIARNIGEHLLQLIAVFVDYGLDIKHLAANPAAELDALSCELQTKGWLPAVRTGEVFSAAVAR